MLRDGKVDIIGYSSRYCMMDCVVLRDGYLRFCGLMEDVTGLNAMKYLTLASISHDHLVKSGCYEGVWKLCGTPRKYVQSCIVGGRTMSRGNRKYMVDKELSDFDVTSLYPAAMEKCGGFLMGIPKVIGKFEPDKYDGYFVRVKVLKVGINREFPLMSTMDNGVRNFRNDMEGEIVFLNEYGLEDAVKFHKMEYEFMDGYYFDEGRNDKAAGVIRDLFSKRLTYKKEGNPLQLICKLIMNTSYGKSYMKPIKRDVVFVSNNLDEYVDKNQNRFLSATRVGVSSAYTVELSRPLVIHKSCPQVGCEVLSYSKRIMNETMCLAEDLGIDIYYQDTDSMFIDSGGIELLSKEFERKYGKPLIGRDLGMFHCDFDMPGCRDIVAVKTWVVGKKVYMNKLRGIDKDGKVLYTFNTRIKGIPKTSLGDLKVTYDKLLEGGEVTFNLQTFKRGGDHASISTEIMTRTLRFPGEVFRIP